MTVQEIPKIIINLPERKDRLESILKEIEYIGGNYIVINGIKTEDPKIGIAQSHILAVETAKQNGWPYVMILEDDCVFDAKEKTLNYVNECLKNIPDKWDILLGGLYEAKTISRNGIFWESVGQFCGLHCYIVNSTFYNTFKSYNPNYHIDRWLNLKGENKIFVSKKLFATQKAGYSDNVKQFKDYKSRLKRFNLLN